MNPRAHGISCTPTCFGFSGITVDGHGIETSRQVLFREVIKTRFGRLGIESILSVESVCTCLYILFMYFLHHSTIWFQHVPTLNPLARSPFQGTALGAAHRSQPAGKESLKTGHPLRLHKSLRQNTGSHRHPDSPARGQGHMSVK